MGGLDLSSAFLTVERSIRPRLRLFGPRDCFDAVIHRRVWKPPDSNSGVAPPELSNGSESCHKQILSRADFSWIGSVHVKHFT
jgi:hypothetical protein